MKKIALSYNSQTFFFKKYLPDIKVINDFREVKNYDLIIFPGGEDVNPARYGEPNLWSIINNRRDEIENAVFMAAIERSKKVIGICRGCQFINVMYGGKLYQDILEQATGYHNRNHTLSWKTDNDPFYKFFSEKTVVSTHHQAIRSTGGRLTCIATHKNIPEVVRSSDGSTYLFQFHPEFETGNEGFFKFISEEW